jgi:hypothetical protein
VSVAREAKARGFPPLIRDLPGLAVITAVEMTNGWMTIPAGTKALITSATIWSKIGIQGRPCACCGISAHIVTDISRLEVDRDAGSRRESVAIGQS